MVWNIRYQSRDGEHIVRLLSRDDAFEVANRLKEDGCVVRSIETEPRPELVDRDQIQRIQTMVWQQRQTPPDSYKVVVSPGPRTATAPIQRRATDAPGQPDEDLSQMELFPA
jgi:hypothetical protein